MNDNNIYNENTTSEYTYVAENNEYESWEDDSYKETPGVALAIIGMILGIISIVIIVLFSCCSPAVACLAALPFAIAGLIVSIIGVKKGQNKGMCIAGIICSALTLLANAVMLVIIIISFVLLGSASAMEAIMSSYTY